nr:hypothetical protein [Tanacetum cinerariifolium]
MLSKKTRLEEACTVTMNERCSAVLLNKLPLKEEDPVSFTIPCDIGNLHIDNALAALGASISLMPYSMYKKLGLGEPNTTRISLELADWYIQIGRPFLATARAMIDVFNKKITLRVGDEEVIFDVDQSIKNPLSRATNVIGVDDLDQTIHLETQELIENDHTNSFLLNDLEKHINQANSEERREQSDSKKSIRHIKIKDTTDLPNSDRSRGSRENNVHMPIWNFCLPKDAVWIMQHPRNLPKMHDRNIPSHGGRLYGIFYGRFLSVRKQDAKPRLIRWVLLLQGFNIEIKDKKGAENLGIDHLSRLENPNMRSLTKKEIYDEFPDEHLMVLKATPDNDEPW